jgi:hypothetical protein
MKRKSIILWGLIVLFIFSISLTILAKEQVYDFRKTNWGMSKEQVKATEDKKPDFEADDRLFYNLKINGDDYICVYRFLEDKLYSGSYRFTVKHVNKNRYIDDYKELKEILTKKYGKLISDEIKWKNDLYKDNKSEWGMAISVGDLEYWTYWETSTTEICLLLTGDNYKITLDIHYYSKKLKEWANKIKEEKAKNQDEIGFKNEPDGFRGLKWGDMPTEDMVFIGSNLYIGNYYYKRDDKLNIGNAKLDHIFYNFNLYSNQFYEVSVSFFGKNNYDNLEIIFEERFGKPTLKDSYSMWWDGKKAKIALTFDSDKEEGCFFISSMKIREENPEGNKQKEVEKAEEDF